MNYFTNDDIMRLESKAAKIIQSGRDVDPLGSSGLC